MAVKKIDPPCYPDMESIKQNADEFGIKVHQLAFNRELHKMYCLCQSPSKYEIKEHLKRLDIICDEIVEIDTPNESNLDPFSNIAKVGKIIASFSHDIRQTLSAATMNSSLIKEKINSGDIEQIKTHVERVEHAIRKINRQVNEVLDFVRVAPLVKKNMSIKKIIQDTLSEFVIPQNMSIKLPDDDVVLSCDAEKIQSVFSNIISNAIHANSQNIIIALTNDLHSAKIDISNDGPGIPKNDLKKIFEPLFTTRSTGTGLGLPICKSIVEQHGGTINATNHPTTFTIILPRYPYLKTT